MANQRSHVVWRIFLAGLMIAIGLGPNRLQAEGTAAATARPSFLIILTDDQELASFSRGVMPYAYARLVDKGLVFDNSYVAQALCCPNRATIVTGQYPRNHGVRYNGPPDGGLAVFRANGLEADSLAVWFKRAGYRTGYFGKYLSGYEQPLAPGHIPPGWDEWFVSYGRSTYFDYSVSDNGHRRQESRLYHDDLVQDMAIRFLQEQRPGQPFLVIVSTWAPHLSPGGLPIEVPQRHRSEFLAEIAPRPPSFNEADVADKASWVRGLPLLTDRHIEKIDEAWRSRLRSLQVVDRLVRRSVLALYRAGLLDETYIFFTSDNGFHAGQHRHRGKNTLYEEDIRVPLVVRGPPGTLRGARASELVSSADLAPTILDLAGLGIPASVDGHSFAPLLRGEAVAWRSWLMIENWGEQQRALHPERTFLGLRGPGLVYARFGDSSREMYDLSADPWQLENIAGRANPVLLRNLEARLADLLACAGSACWAAER